MVKYNLYSLYGKFFRTDLLQPPCKKERNGQAMNILYLLHPKNTVEFLYDDDTFEKGYNCLRNSSYTAIPVISRSGIYVGTVSEGDFLRAIMDDHLFSPEEMSDCTVGDYIRKGWNPPIKVTAQLDELVMQVMDQNFLPVVDDRGCFAGIITRRDIIKHYYDKYIKIQETAGTE